MATALVGREQFLPVGWDAERIPPDENGAGLLATVQPQQKVGEADNCAPAAIARPPDRFRQCVIGAVSKVVAVDDK